MNIIMPEHPDTKIRPGFWKVVGRGTIGKCPKCGEGNLFTRYLKHVECCNVCEERFGHIRADDGPSWLTIIVVGHLFAFILTFTPSVNWPNWAIISVWSAAALMLALLVLPRAKGLFIGVIWRMGCSGSEK